MLALIAEPVRHNMSCVSSICNSCLAITWGHVGDSLSLGGRTVTCTKCGVVDGGAENAGRENDGREIDGPMCRA